MTTDAKQEMRLFNFIIEHKRDFDGLAPSDALMAQVVDDVAATLARLEANGQIEQSDRGIVVLGGSWVFDFCSVPLRCGDCNCTFVERHCPTCDPDGVARMLKIGKMLE